MPTSKMHWPLIALLAATVLAVGVVVWQWTPWQMANLRAKLNEAQTEEARRDCAGHLFAAGEPGLKELSKAMAEGTPECCSIIAETASVKMCELAPTDPKFLAIRDWAFNGFDSWNDSGKAALGELFPELARDSSGRNELKRIVKSCFAANLGRTRATAIRTATGCKFELETEIAQLLKDPEANVRRAAMVAVGPARGEKTILAPEELFPWLNDPDDRVKLLCQAALGTRGLEPEQIEAGRKLTHPEPAERLKLVLELERGSEKVFRDPGPWLERLSRDPDSAVRAAVARIAYGARSTAPEWAEGLQRDSDPTVRRIAGFYKSRWEQLRQAAGGGD